MNALERRFITKLKTEREQYRKKAYGLERRVLSQADEISRYRTAYEELLQMRMRAIKDLVK